MSEDHDDLPPPIGRDELPAGEARAPGAPVRLDGVFTRLDRVVAWCDGWISRWLPEAWNPLAQTGCAANFALAVAVVSGVALLFWYSSSVQFAYSSLEAIGGRTPGGWVRGHCALVPAATWQHWATTTPGDVAASPPAPPGGDLHLYDCAAARP